MLYDILQTTLTARTDFTNLGGVIEGVNIIALSAGRDINLASTTRDTQSSQGKRTAIDRVAGLYITGTGGTLTTSANRDLNINVNGASIINGLLAATSTTLVAGKNININTVLTSSEQAIIWNSNNFRKESFA